MYIDSYYIILVLPAVLLSMYAQFKVNSTFNKFSKVMSTRGVTARDVARMILDRHGLNYIPVEHISGNLSDHYDPKSKVVRLSDSVYNSSSIASIGVAAHECGHAIQHATSYSPLNIRNMIFPVVNISSTLSMPLIILGFIMSYAPLVEIGIILFSAVVLFQIITLPVEFNASRRALAILDENGILVSNELKSTKKVLSAAALTYVAAAIVAIANLLRLILVYRDRD
ncbi:MAG: zinc metallopeptidase [Ruminococcaceae bacterium]|nr:zinc metallopeptidase [Oscillospiraceae bacterium]